MLFICDALTKITSDRAQAIPSATDVTKVLCRYSTAPNLRPAIYDMGPPNKPIDIGNKGWFFSQPKE